MLEVFDANHKALSSNDSSYSVAHRMENYLDAGKYITIYVSV